MRRSIAVLGMVGLVTCLMAGSASAAIVETDKNGGTTGFTCGPVLADDLINTGSAALSSSSVTPAPTYGGQAGWHNGYYGNNVAYVCIYNPIQYPTFTAYLNTTTNTLGYSISSIATYAGWNNNGSGHGNQKFDVYVSYVGSDDFVLLCSVDYEPYQVNGGTGGSSTKVLLTDSSDYIAEGVDAIQLVYSKPTYIGTYGTVINEIDVVGVATTVPEPATMSMLAIGGIAALIRRRRRNRR